MAITHTNRFGEVTYLHGYKAVLAGIFMAVTIPVMLVLGFVLTIVTLLLPVAAVVAVIAGVIMGFSAGWTLLPILLIVIGGLILAFTRIRIS